MGMLDRIREGARDVRNRWTYRETGVGLPKARMPRLGGVWLKRILIAIAVFLLLYYPVGMLWRHKIDDNPDFRVEGELLAGQSHAVAMAAALIDREVNDNVWVANSPFFLPSAMLDNMPNFQKGIVASLARFAFELTDQLGRTRGSSQEDADLKSVSGLLQYPGDVWYWDPTVSLAPTATSEAQYRKAMRALINYNNRLASGDAVFERRADNLLATLDRIALDIGSTSAAIDRHVNEESGFPIDTDADDIFYFTKGQVYGYYMILRELRTDFNDLITERELATAWDELLASLRATVELQPGVVIDGAPDSQFWPSHLASQGFYILRARTQLREISNILLK